MFKRLFCLLLAIIICLSFVACKSNEEYMNETITELEEELFYLESEVLALEAMKEILQSEITDMKVENGTAKYVVTFNIRQKHFTLDIGQHLKDEMNELSIQIPVDKEYYDSIEVGDTIADDFRMGSLIFKGSFGNWDISSFNMCSV